MERLLLLAGFFRLEDQGPALTADPAPQGLGLTGVPRGDATTLNMVVDRQHEVNVLSICPALQFTFYRFPLSQTLDQENYNIFPKSLISNHSLGLTNQNHPKNFRPTAETFLSDLQITASKGRNTGQQQTPLP